jgi:diamine N-acetyltransferase
MSPLPPEGLSIRHAGLEDIGAVVELVGALAAYEKRESENCLTEECLRAEFTSDDCVLSAVLAEIDGRTVAMATVFPTYTTFAAKRGLYIEDLFVIPDYRGQGVGTALLRFIAKMAVERDCGRIEWTTLLWNTPAVEFYESLGARPNDAWTAYRLSGEWLSKLAAQAG